MVQILEKRVSEQVPLESVIVRMILKNMQARLVLPVLQLRVESALLIAVHFTFAEGCIVAKYTWNGFISLCSSCPILGLFVPLDNAFFEYCTVEVYLPIIHPQMKIPS